MVAQDTRSKAVVRSMEIWRPPLLCSLEMHVVDVGWYDFSGKVAYCFTVSESTLGCGKSRPIGYMRTLRPSIHGSARSPGR